MARASGYSARLRCYYLTDRRALSLASLASGSVLHDALLSCMPRVGFCFPQHADTMNAIRATHPRWLLCKASILGLVVSKHWPLWSVLLFFSSETNQPVSDSPLRRLCSPKAHKLRTYFTASQGVVVPILSHRPRPFPPVSSHAMAMPLLWMFFDASFQSRQSEQRRLLLMPLSDPVCELPSTTQ
jgi:hypothetical protein